MEAVDDLRTKVLIFYCKYYVQFFKVLRELKIKIFKMKMEGEIIKFLETMIQNLGQ